ncbi:LysE family translocator [Nocardia mexicana]|uniref:Threonine/homoserine/homoserine lactone efflux protein n=1 Tax=Nocardia mexicana TaxID=279262 RepID=A0A370GUD5_9NOCA|nr:LysE family translocator [Nocardia mexicana]RDI47099.1 threonine/homoserine/homoserine lactone efflux protein [Nocardia mexicana]
MVWVSVSLLLGFIGLCVLLALTPGPDTFLVLRFSIAGRRPGIAAALGSALGGIVWAVVVAAGVAALLEQSATAYRVMKVIGGIYLVYLGIRTLVEHRRKRAAGTGGVEPGSAPPRAAAVRSAFVAGLVSCLFNPKVGLFYLAVLPQFLTEVTFANALTLGAIESTIAAIEMVLLAAAAARAVALLRRPRVRDRLEQISAGVLAALGIGTAASAT